MKKFILIFASIFSSLTYSYESVDHGRPAINGSSKNVNCPIQIVPGKSLGPLFLGQTTKQIEALKMDIKSVLRSESFLIVGRYSVALSDKNTVVMIEADLGALPDCVFYGKKKISKTMTPKEISLNFINCKKEIAIIGGNTTICDGVAIAVGGWAGLQKTPSINITSTIAPTLQDAPPNPVPQVGPGPSKK